MSSCYDTCSEVRECGAEADKNVRDDQYEGFNGTEIWNNMATLKKLCTG